MPDARLDAITSAISNLSTAWGTLSTAAKASPNPRDTVDLLDAGVVDLQSQINNLNAELFRLPTKDIAIDLHTAAS